MVHRSAAAPSCLATLPGQSFPVRSLNSRLGPRPKGHRLRLFWFFGHPSFSSLCRRCLCPWTILTKLQLPAMESAGKPVALPRPIFPASFRQMFPRDPSLESMPWQFAAALRGTGRTTRPWLWLPASSAFAANYAEAHRSNHPALTVAHRRASAHMAEVFLLS